MQFKTIVACLAAIVTLSGALAAFGLSLPKVATKDEIAAHAYEDSTRLEKLVTRVSELSVEVKRNVAESYELRILRQEQSIQEKKARGEPTSLEQQEVIILKRRLREVDQEIDNLLRGTTQ